ncbi:MAG: helix-turn-helix domain-containing protein [Candidatus Paracaedibacter sp.]
MTEKNLIIDRGKRLQKLRKKVGLTRLAFAEQTGMSAHTLKALELGDRELTPQKALLFSNLFTNLFSVFLGEDTHEASFDYLYYGESKKAPGQKQTFTDASDDVYLQSEINFLATNPSYSIFKIQDDLMSPFYNEGDIIAGKKIINKKQFYRYQGHVCIIEPSGGKKCLRRIIKCDGRKVTYCLLNTTTNKNVDFFEEVEVLSIAQVLWHWHLSNLILPSS